MGYLTLTLDEIGEKFLRGELKLRAGRRAKGLCDYCNRKPSTPCCKFPYRHYAKKKTR